MKNECRDYGRDNHDTLDTQISLLLTFITILFKKNSKREAKAQE